MILPFEEIMGKQKTILIVDDEVDIVGLVDFHTQQQGYKTLKAGSGETALELARTEKPDLIILDLMLPGINGLDVCKYLKSEPATAHIPIIMLTAKGEETDIVKGLEMGADDYVTKPFSPRVLMARLNSVIRRKNNTADGKTVGTQYREISIDPGRRKVTVDGHTVELTFTEFEILKFLCAHPGWVFTRNDIVDNVHGDNYPVTDRSIDVQIVGLRKKLGASGRYIETVRGVGYRMQEL